MNPVHQRIDHLLSEQPIVLFMKGTPQFPMCGFSARAVAILQQLGVPFHSVNVLEDQEIREGIKVYGNWPTIPQLYVHKELIGGSDIMMEMYQSGELKGLLMEKGLLKA
ncbi:MAG: Grx4 family monothiol glutaredoxin [Bdellovibrionaceae bacterium]|jgi:monothiol glutaredoxin|nr:Grx4 family monothiol glutaredoxin [Pseudobdellovibrionaceae bacterium]